MRDWHDILKTCDLHNWKEALAAVMTYAQPEEFSSLCGQCQNSNTILAGNPQPPPPWLHLPSFHRPARGQTGGGRRCRAASSGLPVLHLRRQRGETGGVLDQCSGRTVPALSSGALTFTSQHSQLRSPLALISNSFCFSPSIILALKGCPIYAKLTTKSKGSFCNWFMCLLLLLYKFIEIG